MTEVRRSYAIVDPETGLIPETLIPVAGAPGGAHPDLAGHTELGLAPAHPHSYEPSGSIATHAQTAHGLSSHAIDGAFHSGTGVLPTQGQKNALAGTSGTPGTGNEFVTTQDPRNTNARTPVPHGHAESEVTGLIADLASKAPSIHAHDLSHNHTGTYEPSGAVSTHAATPHGGAQVHTTLANGATAMGFGTNGSVKVTPTANATYTTTVPVAGTRCTLLILTSGTTSRTITFGTGFKAVGTLATGTVTARVFAVSWISDGTNLYETGRTAAMVA
jgi:hypothetical protein